MFQFKPLLKKAFVCFLFVSVVLVSFDVTLAMTAEEKISQFTSSATIDKSSVVDKAAIAKSSMSVSEKSALADKLALVKSKSSSKAAIDKSSLIQKLVNAKLLKIKGKKVSYGYANQGDIIGYEGGMPRTCGAGFSTGPHLHFEVRVNGSHTNPRDYLGGRFAWPMDNLRVTQEYGWTDYAQSGAYNGNSHPGIDLASNNGYGAQVKAAGSGEIVFNGIYGGYGHLIIIDHGGGIQTYYGHLIC